MILVNRGRVAWAPIALSLCSTAWRAQRVQVIKQLSNQPLWNSWGIFGRKAFCFQDSWWIQVWRQSAKSQQRIDGLLSLRDVVREFQTAMQTPGPTLPSGTAHACCTASYCLRSGCFPPHFFLEGRLNSSTVTASEKYTRKSPCSLEENPRSPY